MVAKKVGAMYTASEKKFTPLDNVLTVDTGDHTGWAFWTITSGKEPAMFGQLSLPRKKWETEVELKWMWEHFFELKNRLPVLPKDVVLESLEHWGQDEASLAAIRSGKLFKLAYLIGGYANIAQLWRAQVHLVKAREWKGQMDKDATKIRVRFAIGKEFGTSHVTDAVGMGLSLMGVL